MKLLFHHKETRCLPIPYAQGVRCLHGLRLLLYRSTTARAIHESPVISAEIDDEVLDFSAVFPVDTEFLPFSGKGEGEKAVPSFDFPCPVLSFLMRILEIYGAGFFKTAGLLCPSTI